MKHQTIQKKLFHMAALLLGIFFICQMILLFCFNALFDNVKNTVALQNQYITFDSAAEQLQANAAKYFDSPSTEKHLLLAESQDSFSQLSEQISDFFLSPQFEDNRILAKAYLNKLQQLIDYMNSPQEDDAFTLYKQCSHLYDLMVKQYDTTLSFEMTELSEQMSVISANWNLFTVFILIFMCIIFALILIFTSASIQKIVSPLTRLSTHAKAIENQDYEDSVENLLSETSYSEIYILTSAFIHMENTIHEQIEALRDKLELSKKVHSLELENMSAQIALAQTENSLMQSLINPHFLFNCLNLLSSFAIIEKAPMVHEYSLQIAQYLRESLNYVGKYISLDKEFAFLSHYADIQKIRFGSRIAFHFHCEADCTDAIIPAVILQPLVENSLIHGVGFYLQDGKVSVHAQKLNDKRIRIIVEDNGEGISPERLQEIKDNLQTPFKAGQKGTGIRSVLYRLNYYFDNNVEFHMKTQDNITQIIISIPYITKQETI